MFPWKQICTYMLKYIILFNIKIMICSLTSETKAHLLSLNGFDSEAKSSPIVKVLQWGAWKAFGNNKTPSARGEKATLELASHEWSWGSGHCFCLLLYAPWAMLCNLETVDLFLLLVQVVGWEEKKTMVVGLDEAMEFIVSHWLGGAIPP